MPRNIFFVYSCEGTITFLDFTSFFILLRASHDAKICLAKRQLEKLVSVHQLFCSENYCQAFLLKKVKAIIPFWTTTEDLLSNILLAFCLAKKFTHFKKMYQPNLRYKNLRIILFVFCKFSVMIRHFFDTIYESVYCSTIVDPFCLLPSCFLRKMEAKIILLSDRSHMLHKQSVWWKLVWQVLVLKSFYSWM